MIVYTLVSDCCFFKYSFIQDVWIVVMRLVLMFLFSFFCINAVKGGEVPVVPAGALESVQFTHLTRMMTTMFDNMNQALSDVVRNNAPEGVVSFCLKATLPSVIAVGAMGGVLHYLGVLQYLKNWCVLPNNAAEANKNAFKAAENTDEIKVIAQEIIDRVQLLEVGVENIQDSVGVVHIRLDQQVVVIGNLANNINKKSELLEGKIEHLQDTVVEEFSSTNKIIAANHTIVTNKQIEQDKVLQQSNACVEEIKKSVIAFTQENSNNFKRMYEKLNTMETLQRIINDILTRLDAAGLEKYLLNIKDTNEVISEQVGILCENRRVNIAFNNDNMAREDIGPSGVVAQFIGPTLKRYKQNYEAHAGQMNERFNSFKQEIVQETNKKDNAYRQKYKKLKSKCGDLCETVQSLVEVLKQKNYKDEDCDLEIKMLRSDLAEAQACNKLLQKKLLPEQKKVPVYPILQYFDFKRFQGGQRRCALL